MAKQRAKPSRRKSASRARTWNVLGKRREMLRRVVEAYFAALVSKDLAAIPYHDNVTLRAPLAPGGVHNLLKGKEALRTIWWPPIAAIGTVKTKIIDCYFNEDLTGVCACALVELVGPGVTLRVADRFVVNAHGKIIGQENHFDPRDLTNPGWQKGS